VNKYLQEDKKGNSTARGKNVVISQIRRTHASSEIHYAQLLCQERKTSIGQNDGREKRTWVKHFGKISKKCPCSIGGVRRPPCIVTASKIRSIERKTLSNPREVVVDFHKSRAASGETGGGVTTSVRGDRPLPFGACPASGRVVERKRGTSKPRD